MRAILISSIAILIFRIFYASFLDKEQDRYYWDGETKIDYEIDSSYFLIELNNKDISRDNPISQISESQAFRLENDSIVQLIVRSEAKMLQEFTKTVSKISAIRIPGKSGTSFITDEISIKFKNQEDLKLISEKYDLKFVLETNYGAHLFKVKNAEETVNIANEIKENENVEWSTPNFIHLIVKSNDPLYPNQYYLNNTGQAGGTTNIDINAPEAWAITLGCNNIRVAVIDDGVENHEDFDGRVLAGFTPGVNNTNGLPVQAYRAHGMACAGIIAATHNNPYGIKGIAPNSQIIPINIFPYNSDSNNPSGAASSVEIASAITHAWRPEFGNAHILSNSWNGGISNPDINNTINAAMTLGRAGLGAVVIFSSGNSNGIFSGVVYPADLNGVITIGAINKNGNIWNYSSRGSQMDLVAPSGNLDGNGDVVTTDRMGVAGYDPGNYTNTFGGTSAAAPQVSGVAALMLSRNPNLTLQLLRSILQNTATDMGPSGFDNTFGFGRLNAQAAVQASLPIVGTDLLCSSNSFSLQNLPPSSSVTWSVSPSSLFTGSTSGTGSSATLNPSSFSSGQATLTFTVAGACGNIAVQRTFWVGTPQITNMRVNNMSYFTGMNMQVCPGNNWLNVTPVGGNVGNASWTVPSGIAHWVGTNTLDFTYPQNYSNSLTISVRASNSCGQGPNYNFFLSKKTFGCNSSFGLIIYPNPPQDQFSVELKAMSPDASKEIAPLIESAILLNNEGKEVAIGSRNGARFEFNVSQLRKGIYFVHVMIEGELTREQILIE
ncbi:S8 family serine peptidase [Algoriphagus marinus]|uniref:S8 family serine peptidase n=1 Tax=Algoriphagus marinus TaxID=1925762 RepID=UPI00094B7C9E|nr:S8 family serine peptidase [Algoriphagus marinus]